MLIKTSSKTYKLTMENKKTIIKLWIAAQSYNIMMITSLKNNQGMTNNQEDKEPIQ
jgi:hypothetical protein